MSRGIPATSFLKLADVWHDLSDDAVHALQGMLHPYRGGPDLTRYVRLSVKDQAFVTWFLEIAVSEELWHADRAFEDVTEWNDANPHPLRTIEYPPIEQARDWETPFPKLRGREVYGTDRRAGWEAH